MISFGERLKELRQHKDLTLHELGTIIGVARSTISGYESGFRQPSLKLIISLSRALDVSSDYLLGISNYPSIVNFFTPINRLSNHSDEFHWDGMVLDEVELEEIKRLLKPAMLRKEAYKQGHK